MEGKLIHSTKTKWKFNGNKLTHVVLLRMLRAFSKSNPANGDGELHSLVKNEPGTSRDGQEKTNRRRRWTLQFLSIFKVVLLVCIWKGFWRFKGAQSRRARRNAQKAERIANALERKENIEFNKGSVSSKSQVPEDVWWRNVETIPIWTIWIGKHEIIPVVKASMDTCRNIHANDPQLVYRVVTEEDVQNSEERLGFKLHPSYYLLDEVEKTDYIRGGLMHYHGGFYMDGDMLCLKSFRGVLERSYWDFSGAQDSLNYGKYPSLSQNSLGPVRPNSTLTTFWHEELHRTMDSLTPLLKECEKKYDNNIPYTHLRKSGVSICGVGWGGVIDFIRPEIKRNAKERKIGYELHMCDWDGNQVGWYDDMDPDLECHIVHLGTSRDFLERHYWTIQNMCDALPVLKDTVHCPDVGKNT